MGETSFMDEENVNKKKCSSIDQFLSSSWLIFEKPHLFIKKMEYMKSKEWKPMKKSC